MSMKKGIPSEVWLPKVPDHVDPVAVLMANLGDQQKSLAVDIYIYIPQLVWIMAEQIKHDHRIESSQPKFPH